MSEQTKQPAQLPVTQQPVVTTDPKVEAVEQTPTASEQASQPQDQPVQTDQTQTIVAEKATAEGSTQDATPEQQPTTDEKKPPWKRIVDRLHLTKISGTSTAVTAEDIKRKTDLTLKLTSGLIAILVLLNFVLIYLASNKVKELQLVKTQIVTTQNSSLDLTSTILFLESQGTETEPLKRALPDESGLINFVETVEFIAATAASNSSISFSAIAPTGTGNNKYLPFTVNFTTDLERFETFLKQLEKLPYIVEVVSIDIRTGTNTSGVWDATIAARVYVQNPFKTNLTVNQSP